MGFWKNVAYDMQRGMSQKKAIELNAQLRYGELSKEDREKLEAIAEAELKIQNRD